MKLGNPQPTGYHGTHFWKLRTSRLQKLARQRCVHIIIGLIKLTLSRIACDRQIGFKANVLNLVDHPSGDESLGMSPPAPGSEVIARLDEMPSFHYPMRLLPYPGAVPAACFQYRLCTNGILVTVAFLLFPLTKTPTSVPALWCPLST